MLSVVKSNYCMVICTGDCTYRYWCPCTSLWFRRKECRRRSSMLFLYRWHRKTNLVRIRDERLLVRDTCLSIPDAGSAERIMEYERYAWRHSMNPRFERKEVTLLDASLSISTVLCVCKKRMGKPTSYSYSKLSVRDSRWESLWKIRSVVWWFEILVLKFLLQDDNVLTNYVIHIGRDRFIAIRSGNMFLMIVNVFLETDSCLRYLHERLRTILEYCSWYPIDLKIIIVLYSRVSRKTIQCNQILILGRMMLIVLSTLHRSSRPSGG